MMAKAKNSKKGKGTYAAYKASNKVEKNKIKKLERHCRNFPNDEEGKKNLERIKKHGYTGRKTPNAPGSIGGGYPSTPIMIVLQESMGEQLARLLDRKLLRTTNDQRNAKTPIRYKKRKNVQS